MLIIKYHLGIVWNLRGKIKAGMNRPTGANSLVMRGGDSVDIGGKY